MTERFVALTDAEAELTVLRSRFLALSRAIENEEHAAEILTALRKKYYDATHVCYAYVADEAGITAKSSDDGEPASTAGAPIMSVLSGGAYRKSLIAVVRWFGGTKLGVGGLIKAYSDAAALVADRAKKLEYVLSEVCEAEVGYEMIGKIGNAVAAHGGRIINAEYVCGAKLTIAYPKSSGLLGALIDLTRGKTEFIPRGERYEIY